MKRKLYLVIPVLIVFCWKANAQNYTYFTEYFDDQATAITGTQASAATTPTSATIKSGSWTTYYSYRAGSGCTPNDPSVTSAKQLRVLATGTSSPSGLSSNPNGPYAYLITPTLSNGVNTVSWKNVSTTTSGAISIYTSTNNGGSWTLFQSVPTVSTGCSDYSVTINNAAVNRIKFQNETNSNQELDNITITSVTPLPVVFSGAKAYNKGKGIAIEWTVSTESNIGTYAVERSLNGSVFSTVSTVASKGNSNTGVNYGSFDPTPSNGVNYYRIKAIDKDGNARYTGVLVVNAAASAEQLQVTPNPVRKGELNIQLGDVARGTYSIKLYNNLGQLVFSSRFVAENGRQSHAFTLPSTIKAGIYNLQVNGEDVNLDKRVIVE